MLRAAPSATSRRPGPAVPRTHRAATAPCRAGAAFIAALADPAALRDQLLQEGIDLDALRGAGREAIVAAISAAFATRDGDREKTELAIAVALSEACRGLDIAALPDLPDDRIDLALIAYVRECVFAQIMAESGDAFDGASAADAVATEKDLHDLIRGVVEAEMQAALLTPVRRMSRASIEAVQLRAIADVWRRWEAR